MKIGYYRQDDDCHNYVVPEDQIEQFDQHFMDMGGLSYLDNPDLFELFEEKFSQYRVDGELYDMKIIIEET